MSEPFDGPVHRAFRVASYPTKYLIGKDGTILSDSPHPLSPVLEQQIREALGLAPRR
jgi:hypothetical protein